MDLLEFRDFRRDMDRKNKYKVTLVMTIVFIITVLLWVKAK